MNRRRWFVWLGCFVVALICLGGLWIFQTRERGPIRYDNVDKIEAGMSMADVEKLLGCPPGNHASGPMQTKFVANDGESAYVDVGFSGAESPAKRGGTVFVWHGDRGDINVEFDEANRVVDKVHRQGRRVPSSLWRFLEKTLGLDL